LEINKTVIVASSWSSIFTLPTYAFLFGAAPYAADSSLVFWYASSVLGYDMDYNQLVCSQMTLLIILTA
jgi:hypothetical protein